MKHRIHYNDGKTRIVEGLSEYHIENLLEIPAIVKIEEIPDNS